MTVTFSQFVKHYNENHSQVSHDTMQQIRRDAVARLKDRWNDECANSALDFSDLVNRIEIAIGGK